ncbi:MAG TPA: aminomethyl-transferring glycine dehydrogenase subunit GcvPA [Clostridia bacterium]|nr:aminomethyl-transferring glycine dehydrogenase subunit GcvPA [Clostridia bacterium]
MHKYIPNTAEEIREMIDAIGVSSVDDLFSSIPEEIRFKGRLNLPDKMTEQELDKYMRELARMNSSTDDLVCFLGAGAYDHYIPSVVNALTSRSEFYTAYTPYQAELSQGVLQAIFEFQTMVSEITGMDAANASMYDGSSSTAEACSIALVNAHKRNKILISEGLHPETRKVIRTYMSGRDAVLEEIPLKDGETDYETLAAKCDENTAAVCIQSPNFFGIVEDMDRVGEIARENNAAFIVNTDLISLGILKPPSESGADFVVGEAQGLGNPLSFGGPHLGFFATTNKYLRKMPGRIVGETTDVDGKRGYVLTLQAREQHIRREKATSNICSNHALNALAATIYMSVLGKQGLQDLALRCANNARFASEKLVETGKFRLMYDKPFFKEFLLEADEDPAKINERLLKNGILGGYEASRCYPELGKGWLVAVTERRTRKEIMDLAEKAGGTL